MQATIRKFQLGFLVIGVLVGILFIWFLAVSINGRQDVKVQKSASQIADKLNDYVINNQKIPGSLSDAGIDDIPPQITYKKLSDSKYKFCVDYKTSTKEPEAVQSARFISSFYLDGPVGNGGFGSFTSESSLYIPENHDKGEFCQTIEPYIYSSDNFNLDEYNFDSSSNSNDTWDSDYYQFD